jgi:hypothetical protein
MIHLAAEIAAAWRPRGSISNLKRYFIYRFRAAAVKPGA